MSKERYRSKLRPGCSLLLCVLLCLLAVSLGTAQDQQGQALFLVARDVVRGPVFSQSAVLMLPVHAGRNNRLIVGLVINKPASVALSRFFPTDPELSVRTAMVYLGGPVEPESLGVVFRSPTAIPQATPVVGDLYVSFDSQFIKGLLKNKQQTQEFRLFAGRAQWSPNQLQNEVLRKAWYRVRANSSIIFSTDPQYIWHALSDLAQPSPLVRFSDPSGGARFRPQDLLGNAIATIR